MVITRGLLSLLIFWIAFISAQTLASSFLLNTANLPSFLSFLIGVIAGILALYILFFNPLSYLLGIIITSVIGAFITYISLVIILNDFDYTLSWNTLQSQSIYLIIAAMIFLIFGIVLQVVLHNRRRTPRPSKRQWGLETFKI